MNQSALVQVVLAGGTLASLYYWVYTIPRQNRTKEDFKWWLRTIVPMSMVIAATAKSFHWF